MGSNMKKRGMKDEVKGTAKEVAGKVQKAVGDLTGNKSQQRRGALKETEGKVQKKVGKVERAIEDES